jgi:membrane protease YdiL (CAAX protease family)
MSDAPSNLRPAILLGAAAALSTALAMPYLMALMPEVFAEVKAPLPLLIVAQFLQAFVMFTLMAWAGIKLGRGAGLGAPLLQRWTERLALPDDTARGLRNALIIGALCGALVVALDALLKPWMPEALRTLPTPAWWKGLLASSYGAIAEEVMVRLFVLTGLVWLVSKLRRRPPTAADFWIAIVFSAALFGVGHLPAAAQLVDLTPAFIARTVLLNMVVGVPCGWLYWRFGLEYAIVAHLGADLVLHVLMAALA